MNQQASKRLSPSPLEFQEAETDRLKMRPQPKEDGKATAARASNPMVIQAEDYHWPLSLSGIESDIREELIVEFYSR